MEFCLEEINQSGLIQKSNVEEYAFNLLDLALSKNDRTSHINVEYDQITYVYRVSSISSNFTDEEIDALAVWFNDAENIKKSIDYLRKTYAIKCPLSLNAYKLMGKVLKIEIIGSPKRKTRKGYFFEDE